MKVEFNKEHLALARRTAAEGIVLLKNNKRTLPLSKKDKVALFGRNQIDTFKGGGGSADLWHIPVLPFADGLEEVGRIYTPLLEKYRAYSKANEDKTRNRIYPQYTYSLPEIPLSDAEILSASSECKTAIVFIGRCVRENFDIKDIPGEYRITEQEENLIKRVTKYFGKSVLVLNIPGLMDISFLDTYKFDAILHTFMPGMEAGHALADVIYGDVTPCGKLVDSFAKSVIEYPTNDGFATDKVIYSEGIYMGYRYFDTFSKDVVYPFGFGLSYTEFFYGASISEVNGLDVAIQVVIHNIGDFKGRETVQCYLSCPDGKLDKAERVLCAFSKTKLLSPYESELVTLKFNLTDFSSYCEENASYILEAGDYKVYIGANIKDTKLVCTVRLNETVICRKVKNRLVPVEKINELKNKRVKNTYSNDVLFFDTSNHKTIIASDEAPAVELKKAKDCTFDDLMNGRCNAEELVACLSDEQLSLLVTADGLIKRTDAGIEPNEDLVCGEGTHTHAIKELGIPSSVMQDGPAGLRGALFENPVPPESMRNARDCIAYPCPTLVACTWDVALAREIGEAIACDLDRYGFNGWCAPSINLHRNPLCGRNFEYFSEDPYLSAQMAIAEISGIQENRDGTPTGIYAVLKHFICNESEEKRLESDSIVSERAARELYLRAFQYTIEAKPPLSIMTSYNKVNGKYTSARNDLIEGICRTEWGYNGLIMTDWCVWADVMDCIRAGIDTDMPGRYITPDMWKNGDRALFQRRVISLINHLARTKHHRI